MGLEVRALALLGCTNSIAAAESDRDRVDPLGFRVDREGGKLASCPRACSWCQAAH